MEIGKGTCEWIFCSGWWSRRRWGQLRWRNRYSICSVGYWEGQAALRDMIDCGCVWWAHTFGITDHVVTGGIFWSLWENTSHLTIIGEYSTYEQRPPVKSLIYWNSVACNCEHAIAFLLSYGICCKLSSVVFFRLYAKSAYRFCIHLPNLMWWRCHSKNCDRGRPNQRSHQPGRVGSCHWRSMARFAGLSEWQQLTVGRFHSTGCESYWHPLGRCSLHTTASCCAPIFLRVLLFQGMLPPRMLK